MRKLVLTLTLSPLASISSAQETKPAPKTSYHPVPVKDAREPSPVNPTPESIAECKKIYSYDCASCHVATGDGKTDVAKDLKVPDLTDSTVRSQRPDRRRNLLHPEKRPRQHAARRRSSEARTTLGSGQLGPVPSKEVGSRRSEATQLDRRA